MIKIHGIHDLHEEKVLKELIAEGEGPTLEFKSHIIPIPEIAKIISSFANTEGGIILFGIDDKGNSIGFKDVDKFNDLVMKSFALTKFSGFSYGILHLNEKPIGCILIWPEHGLPISINKRYFRRSGSTTIEYNKDELKYVIEERTKPQILSIQPKDIEKFLKLADEDTLIEVLLVPILRDFNFHCVSPKGHKDKSLEYGQDIRGFKFQLPTGHWLYFAAQVKIGPITYSAKKPSRNIEEILVQIGMALKKKMFDFQTNSYHLPDYVFLIISGDMAEGARGYLCEQLEQTQQPRILFLDSNLIIEICEKKGLPRGIQIEIKKYLNTIESSSSKDVT